MSDKTRERIAVQEEYERETNARNDGEFDEGMRSLARICGLPDTREGMRQYMRRKMLRQVLFRVGVLIVGLAIGAWLIFRLLT